jgi:hypothetical protein
MGFSPKEVHQKQPGRVALEENIQEREVFLKTEERNGSKEVALPPSG